MTKYKITNRYRTMKDVKQLHTNITFKKFPEDYRVLEIQFYQSMIRFLTLGKFKFIEHTIEGDGHYIFTVTGMYKLDSKTKLFGRVHENDLTQDQILTEQKLTYYAKRKKKEKNKYKLTSSGYTYHKPENEPAIRMTAELKREIITQLHKDNKTLARQFKCSASTIYLIRRKYNETQDDEI